jgi:hypothetical protein
VNTTQELTSLLSWSEPKTVKTRVGQRTLQTAEPTATFWSLWRSSKEELKSAGISVGKSGPSNDWQVCWWQAVERTPQATIERMNGGAVKAAQTDEDAYNESLQPGERDPDKPKCVDLVQAEATEKWKTSQRRREAKRRVSGYWR